jgi:hypothetical protein
LDELDRKIAEVMFTGSGMGGGMIDLKEVPTKYEYCSGDG